MEKRDRQLDRMPPVPGARFGKGQKVRSARGKWRELEGARAKAFYNRLPPLLRLERHHVTTRRKTAIFVSVLVLAGVLPHLDMELRRGSKPESALMIFANVFFFCFKCLNFFSFFSAKRVSVAAEKLCFSFFVRIFLNR